MKKLNIDCIILAAGESRRMGQPKQVMPIQGKPLVRHCVELALSCCHRVIVVQGAVLLKEFLPVDDGLCLVSNPDFRAGQLGSLQVGLQNVLTPYCFIMLADLPCVQADTFFRLAEAIGTHCVAYPGYKNRRGHPVLVNRQAMNMLLTALPEERAMKVLEPLNPLAVEVDDSGIYMDCDTYEDVERIRHADVILHIHMKQ